MKTTTRFIRKVEAGDVCVRFEHDEEALPDLVTVEYGPNQSFTVPADVLERAARMLAEARRDIPTHYGTEVCAEHGYFKHPRGGYRCPMCHPEEAAKATQ